MLSPTDFDTSFNNLWSLDVSWPPDDAPLREAVAHLLLDEKLAGYRCCAEQLLRPLNSLGDANKGRRDVMTIDASLIRRAFGGCGDEYSVPYRQMGIKEGGSGVLYCRVDKMVARAMPGGGWDADGSTVTDFGFYDSDIAGRLSYEAPDVHPLDNWTEFRRTVNVSTRVRQRLNIFLKERQAKKNRGKTERKRERRKSETEKSGRRKGERRKSDASKSVRHRRRSKSNPDHRRRERRRSDRRSKSIPPRKGDGDEKSACKSQRSGKSGRSKSVRPRTANNPLMTRSMRSGGSKSTHRSKSTHGSRTVRQSNGRSKSTRRETAGPPGSSPPRTIRSRRIEFAGTKRRSRSSKRETALPPERGGDYRSVGARRDEWRSEFAATRRRSKSTAPPAGLSREPSSDVRRRSKSTAPPGLSWLAESVSGRRGLGGGGRAESVPPRPTMGARKGSVSQLSKFIPRQKRTIPPEGRRGSPRERPGPSGRSRSESERPSRRRARSDPPDGRRRGRSGGTSDPPGRRRRTTSDPRSRVGPAVDDGDDRAGSSSSSSRGGSLAGSTSNGTGPTSSFGDSVPSSSFGDSVPFRLDSDDVINVLQESGGDVRIAPRPRLPRMPTAFKSFKMNKATRCRRSTASSAITEDLGMSLGADAWDDDDDEPTRSRSHSRSTMMMSLGAAEWEDAEEDDTEDDDDDDRVGLLEDFPNRGSGSSRNDAGGGAGAGRAAPGGDGPSGGEGAPIPANGTGRGGGVPPARGGRPGDGPNARREDPSDGDLQSSFAADLIAYTMDGVSEEEGDDDDDDDAEEDDPAPVSESRPRGADRGPPDSSDGDPQSSIAAELIAYTMDDVSEEEGDDDDDDDAEEDDPAPVSESRPRGAGGGPPRPSRAESEGSDGRAPSSPRATDDASGPPPNAARRWGIVPACLSAPRPWRADRGTGRETGAGDRARDDDDASEEGEDDADESDLPPRGTDGRGPPPPSRDGSEGSDGRSSGSDRPAGELAAASPAATADGAPTGDERDSARASDRRATRVDEGSPSLGGSDAPAAAPGDGSADDGDDAAFAPEWRPPRADRGLRPGGGSERPAVTFDDAQGRASADAFASESLMLEARSEMLSFDSEEAGEDSPSKTTVAAPTGPKTTEPTEDAEDDMEDEEDDDDLVELLEDFPNRGGGDAAFAPKWRPPRADRGLRPGGGSEKPPTTFDDAWGRASVDVFASESLKLEAHSEMLSFDSEEEARGDSPSKTTVAAPTGPKTTESSRRSEGSAGESSSVSDEGTKGDGAVADSSRTLPISFDPDDSHNVPLSFSDPMANGESKPWWNTLSTPDRRDRSTNSVGGEEEEQDDDSNVSSPPVSSAGASVASRGPRSKNREGDCGRELAPSVPGRTAREEGGDAPVAPENDGFEDDPRHTDRRVGRRVAAEPESATRPEEKVDRADPPPDVTESYRDSIAPSSRLVPGHSWRRSPTAPPADAALASSGLRSKNTEGDDGHRKDAQDAMGSYRDSIAPSSRLDRGHDWRRSPTAPPADASVASSGSRPNDEESARAPDGEDESHDPDHEDARNETGGFLDPVAASDFPRHSPPGFGEAKPSGESDGRSERSEGDAPEEASRDGANPEGAFWKETSGFFDSITSLDFREQSPPRAGDGKFSGEREGSGVADAARSGARGSSRFGEDSARRSSWRYDPRMSDPLADEKWGLSFALEHAEGTSKSATGGGNQSSSDRDIRYDPHGRSSNRPRPRGQSDDERQSSQPAVNKLYTRLISDPGPSASAGVKSFNGSTSEEETSKIVSFRFTPFRPMLPRELLLSNNLRRLRPTMPLPEMSANSSVPAARVGRPIAGEDGHVVRNDSETPSTGSDDGGGGGESDVEASKTRSRREEPDAPKDQPRLSLLGKLYPAMRLISTPPADDAPSSGRHDGGSGGAGGGRRRDVEDRDATFEESSRDDDSTLDDSSDGGSQNVINFNFGGPSSRRSHKVSGNPRGATAGPAKRSLGMRRISERPEMEEEEEEWSADGADDGGGPRADLENIDEVAGDEKDLSPGDTVAGDRGPAGEVVGDGKDRVAEDAAKSSSKSRSAYEGELAGEEKKGTDEDYESSSPEGHAEKADPASGRVGEYLASNTDWRKSTAWTPKRQSRNAKRAPRVEGSTPSAPFPESKKMSETTATDDPTETSTATARFGKVLEECRSLIDSVDDITLSSDGSSGEDSTNRETSCVHSSNPSSFDRTSMLKRSSQFVSELSLGVDCMYGDGGAGGDPDSERSSDGESGSDGDDFPSARDDGERNKNGGSSRGGAFRDGGRSSHPKKKAFDISDLSLGVDFMYGDGDDADERFDSEDESNYDSGWNGNDANNNSSHGGSFFRRRNSNRRKKAFDVSDLSLGVDFMYDDDDDDDDYDDMDELFDLEEKSTDESEPNGEDVATARDGPPAYKRDSSWRGSHPTAPTTHSSGSVDKRGPLNVSDRSSRADGRPGERRSNDGSRSNGRKRAEPSPSTTGYAEARPPEGNGGPPDETPPLTTSDEPRTPDEGRREEGADDGSRRSSELLEVIRGRVVEFDGSYSGAEGSSGESGSYDSGADERPNLRSSRLHIDSLRDSIVSELSFGGASALAPERSARAGRDS